MFGRRADRIRQEKKNQGRDPATVEVRRVLSVKKLIRSMKGSCILVASFLAAAYTVALTSGYHEGTFVNSHGSSKEKEKYAPKFDGLRFIETLVTAHR